MLHVVLGRNIARSDVIKGPYSGTQLDHLSRMLRESDIIVYCHEQVQMNTHTFMTWCALVQTVGLTDTRYVVLKGKKSGSVSQ